ncbi:MAG: hypothetical protein HDKAJFGB_00697 [Anaerolineae bacterium]|nr:hypothetical protein [Anaerolineae bacterium]
MTGVLHRVAVRAARGENARQYLVRGHCQIVPSRALGDDPFFKFRRVAHVKTREEFAMIQRGEGLELGALFGGERKRVGFGLERFNLFKFPYVRRYLRAFQFHRIALDFEIGFKRFLEVGENLAQIIFGVNVGEVAPQERGERIARMSAARDGEIRQQRGRFG